MIWSLFRWVWRLEGPLHVGIPPAGSLDRCRLYVPDRNLWAAMTAELARLEMGESPENLDKYEKISQKLKSYCRFGYLYPSERFSDGWKTWLPCFKKGEGLCWLREDDGDLMQDRAFRRKLMDARPSTAINPRTDSAMEGSLHETEVVNQWWRGAQGEKSMPVAMTGYLFCNDADIYSDICKVREINIGGDTRYGLGKMIRVEIEETEMLFGSKVKLDDINPKVFSREILFHLKAGENDGSILGSLESLSGWDVGKPKHMSETNFWAPGSRFSQEKWQEITGTGT